MEDGLTIEQGTAEQIFSAPSGAYTRSLLDAVPRLENGFDIFREVGE